MNDHMHFWGSPLPIDGNHPAFLSAPCPSSVIRNFPAFAPLFRDPILASHDYNTVARPFPFFQEPVIDRRIQHYSSSQTILLVGEGDFSFSNALAMAFGSAHNMVATSLDSEEKLLHQYEAASITLSNLKKLGALVLHGVDATCMAAQKLLRLMSFDCIVYNFPHAGFHGSEDDKKVIKRHRRLVKLFFFNAAKLLRRNGEIHVSHKVKKPYAKWKLEKQAAKCGLVLKESCPFDQRHYPGYVNRRGDGATCGGTFHLGPCKTFKFVLSPSLERPPLPRLPISGFLQTDVYNVAQSQDLMAQKIYPFLRASVVNVQFSLNDK